MYSRLSEAKNIKDIDVLIIGSSHAFRGIDTRYFEKRGLSAFNLGSSSQTPIQTKLLLERYLDQIHPKMIVYDVFPYFFTTDGVESALNIIGCDRNDKYSMEMALDINNLKVYNTLFYGYFRDVLNLNAGYQEPTVIGQNTYIPGGYVEKDLHYYHPQEASETVLDFKDKQFEAFEEVIQILKEKGYPYILIDAPITHSLLKSYTNRDWFIDKMKTYGPFYDFNKMVELNDSIHFYDKDHLNIYGVEIFDNKLIDLLEANYL